MPRQTPLPFPEPRSYSVAPAPRSTERTLAGIQRVVAERAFADLEELNAFLNSPEGRHAVETSEPTTPLGRAQELAYDAWEATGPRRYQLARQALALDPRCSDAWLILAEEERSWRKQRRCFERAVEAAERAAREEGWLKDGDAGDEGEAETPGLYRRHMGLRAYVRARVALARCLAEGGHLAEARALYDDLLRRDHEDPLGLRYEVLPLYHALDDRAALRDLLARYEKEESCFLAWERLWLALAEGEQRRVVTRRARRALKANPHVPDHLLGLADAGDPRAPYYSPGSADEAAFYAALARIWWANTPVSLSWLVDHVVEKRCQERGAAASEVASAPADRAAGRRGRRRAFSVYQLKVTLRGLRPPIWRRFLVRDDATLAELHQTLQIVMGWTNSHLYRFEIAGADYVDPELFEEDFEPPLRNARRAKLRQVLGGEGFRFRYVYDFGDYWEHDLVVERVLPPEDGTSYPRCLKGRRTCPPEDCGGVWGYQRLLAILADPQHEEREESLRWLAGQGRSPFDPEAFDLETVNEALRHPFLFDVP